MATISERVHVMKENFMTWHNQGYSIPEIAEMSHISFSCVYNHLQEIADENGVTRDSLLQLVRTERSERVWSEEARRVKVNGEQMRQEFTVASDSIARLIKQIDEIIEEEEQ